MDEKGFTYESGAHRSEKAPRFDYIHPAVTRREVAVWEKGIPIHGEFNYRKGFTDPLFMRDVINHTYGHLLKIIEGDTSEDHWAHIRCNSQMAIEAEEAKQLTALSKIPH
jgi:hypothetical protein